MHATVNVCIFCDGELSRNHQPDARPGALTRLAVASSGKGAEVAWLELPNHFQRKPLTLRDTMVREVDNGLERHEVAKEDTVTDETLTLFAVAEPPRPLDHTESHQQSGLQHPSPGHRPARDTQRSHGVHGR